MSKKFLGIIDDTVNFSNLGDLIMYRSVGAIPFLGSYRLIDFPLSCFRHAYVTNVAIYTKGKFRSLQEHVGSGKTWDLFSKRDGLFFLPKMDNNLDESKILSFQHINEHIGHLLKSKEEYCLITNTYVLGIFDYDDIVNKHLKSNCDITEVYKDNERLNIFVLSRKLLIELVLESFSLGYTNIIEIIDLSKKYRVNVYEFTNDVLFIKSINDYYFSNMRLLDIDLYKKIFTNNKPIITKHFDCPPTFYKKGAKALNSILACGIISQGLVENSIVFRQVMIDKSACIKNSIINQGCIIGENCVIENAILDKECIIAPNIKVIGKIEKPLFLKKHSKLANYNI